MAWTGLKNSQLFLRRIFKSRIYYIITVTITLLAICFAYIVRLNDLKATSLNNCYNQTQIIPNCYDQPRCYNSTMLKDCFEGAGFKYEDAHDINQMWHLRDSMNVSYLVFIGIIIAEIVLRFISDPQWDVFYDALIVTMDFICTIRAITGVDSYIYYGIALPLRVGLFVADIDMLRPIFYKISMAAPKLVYFFLLFTTMMYFFGVCFFLYFSGENNPGCEACQVYYPNLETSMVTSVGVATLNDFSTVVKDMAKEVSFNSLFTYAIFFLYGITTQFVIFNCITAVIVDIVLSPDVKIPDNASNSFWNRAILELFLELFSGIIPAEEREAMQQKSSFDKLRSLYSIIKFKIKNLFKGKSYVDEDSLLLINDQKKRQSRSDEDTLQSILRVVLQMDKQINDIQKRLSVIEHEVMN
ncbi:kinectin [Acrasis kona]|uniref:Kinectin n=1 Tax=Acrasis kona TaxID=1008807 RepID=A0AAW2YKP0_9EUKA